MTKTFKQTQYSKKLLDPRWQKKRLEIMNRDDFTCTCCGDKESTLNIHHKSYKNNPWEVDNDQLITLCLHCHKLYEYLKDVKSFNGEITHRISPSGTKSYLIGIDRPDLGVPCCIPVMISLDGQLDVSRMVFTPSYMKFVQNFLSVLDFLHIDHNPKA